LSETEAKQILRSYGIPAVETIVAPDEEQAVKAAVVLGFQLY
jgi:acyl-CoA synthetase (NDP forming)